MLRRRDVPSQCLAASRELGNKRNVQKDFGSLSLSLSLSFVLSFNVVWCNAKEGRGRAIRRKEGEGGHESRDRRGRGDGGRQGAGEEGGSLHYSVRTGRPGNGKAESHSQHHFERLTAADS